MRKTRLLWIRLGFKKQNPVTYCNQSKIFQIMPVQLVATLMQRTEPGFISKETQSVSAFWTTMETVCCPCILATTAEETGYFY